MNIGVSTLHSPESPSPGTSRPCASAWAGRRCDRSPRRRWRPGFCRRSRARRTRRRRGREAPSDPPRRRLREDRGGIDHRAPKLLRQKPGRLVGDAELVLQCRADMPLECVAIDAPPEPGRQRQFRPMHRRASGERGCRPQSRHPTGADGSSRPRLPPHQDKQTAQRGRRNDARGPEIAHSSLVACVKQEKEEEIGRN